MNGKSWLVVLMGVAVCGASWAQDLVTYHISDAKVQAVQALRNIRNHLDTDPSAKVTVVSHGAGVDFLLEGAKDSKGREFSGMVGELSGKGVQFRVCNNTLVTRNIDPSKVVMEAKIVPSGVAEVARLQAKEGFVYLKP